MRGLQQFYVLFFIHVESRRVHLVGMTPNPDAAWMKERAHELCEYFDQQRECRPTHIVRDRDGKFTAEFCSIVESAGIEFRPTPARSPNLNAFAETWVRAVKHECLDHFLVFGERHLQYLLDEYVAYFHEQRPHQGLGNRPPIGEPSPPEVLQFAAADVACRDRLGGLLKYYERKAA